MGVQCQEPFKLFTLFDRLVNEYCQLLYLAFLLFKVAKPAGSFNTANLTADVCLQILDLLLVTQTAVPAQLGQDIIELNATSIKYARLNSKSLAVFDSMIFAASPSSALGCR